MVTALAVKPAQEDGNSTRIMAQMVTRPGDDPKGGRPMGTGYHPGIQRRNDLVVTAVDQQEITGCQSQDRPFGR